LQVSVQDASNMERQSEFGAPEKAEVAVHEEGVYEKKLTRKVLWKLDTRQVTVLI
jgi:hypothetical protein